LDEFHWQNPTWLDNLTHIYIYTGLWNEWTHHIHWRWSNWYYWM